MKLRLWCMCAVLLCAATVVTGDDPTAWSAASPPAESEFQVTSGEFPGDTDWAVGTRDTYTQCPADSIYAQSPCQSGCVATASDISSSYKAYDNFTTYAAIENLTWWGTALVWDGGYNECTPPDPDTFLIEIWNDDGTGAPDLSAPICTYTVSVSPVADGNFGTRTIWKYYVDLVPFCDAYPAQYWISIYGASPDGCRFMWLNSPDGDGVCYQNAAVKARDLAFCMGGQFVQRFGACCDEMSGDCQDNVPEQACLGAQQRFAADTLCADLVPPCAPPPFAACCIDGICIADFTEAECLAANGSWYEGESCLASPPFECPAPPGCPEGSLFAQNVTGATGWHAYTCSSYYDYYAYEDFWGVGGEICDLHFFGLELTWNGAWASCDDPDITFDIIFYPDNDGQPNLANPTCAYLNVPPTIRTTYDDQLYNGRPLRGYAFDLSPCCVRISGWLSVYDADGNNCVFLWMDSPEGNNFFWRDTTGELVGTVNNLNMCLTGEPVQVYGACCNEATSVCTDNVELHDCSGPLMRFEPLPTTCATLDPPCGQAPGACCFTSGDCQILTSADCAGAGGVFLGPNTNCAQCPCLQECLPGMVLEGEPICSDEYDDAYNGGCNSDPNVFQSITACDMVICGTSGTFTFGGANRRDTDWYEVIVEGPGTLHWAMVPGWNDVDGLIFIMRANSGDCVDHTVEGSTTGAGCTLLALSAAVPAGPHTYWLWAGPADFTGVPCGSTYYAWAEFECAQGACCFENDACDLLTWGECLVNGGEWDGSASCSPNPCVACDYRGDSNCDGSVNSYDIDGFIAAVSGEANWIAYHGGAPPCDYMCANDMNCDNAVNSYDIDRFIMAVSAGTPLPCP